MTKTISIKSFKLEFNIIKEKQDSSREWKTEKKVKDIETELMCQTIEKERQERLAAIHWMN